MVSGYVTTLAAALQVACSPELGSLRFTGVSTDSRKIRPGEVFVALVGERFDGHAFIPQAMAQGSVLVISQYPVAAPHLCVPDTLRAYQQIGRWWRSQFSLPVIAITGSAGKTSTKEMLAAALSHYGSVLKSQANHNNDIGVTETLLALEPEHDFLVLEMAMRASGEIARLAQIAQPTHGIITNIGMAHIGRLGSQQAIAQAKCELLQEVPDIIAILNGEDELLLKTAKPMQRKTISFGLDHGDVRGKWDPDQQTVKVGSLTFPVPLPGRHQALNWMSVVALIQSLTLDLSPLQAPIVLSELNGRNQQYCLAGGIRILDETYNAAPEAMIAALQLLKQTPAHRHWAVLGPMRELGDHAEKIYHQVGSMAASLKLDYICLLDPKQEMKEFLTQLDSDSVRCFSTAEELVRILVNQVEPGDCLLFKASRSVELERILERFSQQWGTPRS
jgi:UDP-N-acetylmuramoyl-tripeptide--D-alanyl-D-alanine ligase